MRTWNIVKVVLRDGAYEPVQMTEGAAGWDVRTNIKEPITVEPWKRVTLPTGVCVQLPPGTYWDGRARSGLSFNHGLMLINGAGVIDEDYRNEIRFQYLNAGEQPYTFNPGDRIGQVILTRYIGQFIDVVDELDDTERGGGGFGSTGKA